MTLTDWFPGDIKPVRPGVYEVEQVGGNLGGHQFYSYWTGDAWMLNSFCVCNALSHRNVITLAVIARWRGLAEDPSKAGGA